MGINGRAECTIRAGTVVIGGAVKGNVFAEEKVLILSTGMMIGNIHTPRLIAEEGVILNGSCLVRIDKERKLTQHVQNEDLESQEEKGEATAEDFTSQGSESPGDEQVYSAAGKGELTSWKE